MDCTKDGFVIDADLSLLWQDASIIPALVRLRQKDQKLQATLGCGEGLVFDVHCPCLSLWNVLSPSRSHWTLSKFSHRDRHCNALLKKSHIPGLVYSNNNRTKMAYLSRFQSKAGLQNA